MRSSTHPPANRLEDQYRARLTGAMLFSLLLHGLILSLQFGIPGLGLPALELPWRDRRAQAVDLQVVLADVARSRETADAIESAPAEAEKPVPPVPALQAPSGILKLYPSPPAKADKETKRKPESVRPPPPVRKPPPRTKREQPVIALAEPRQDSFIVASPATEKAPPLEDLPEPLPEQPALIPEPVPAEPQSPPVDSLALQRAEEQRIERELEAKQQEERARRDEEARVLALEAKKREDAARQEQLKAEREAREQELRRQAEEALRREQALAAQRQREELLARERDDAARRALELEAQRREEARRLELARAEREALELQARRQAEEAARQQALALQRQKEQREQREQMEADLAREREREEAAQRALELEAKRREDARLDAARLEREAKELAARKQAEEAEHQRQASLERQRLANEAAARHRAEADAAAARQRKQEQEADVLRGLAETPRPAAGALPRDLIGGGLAGRASEQARRSEIFRSDAPVREPAGQDAPAQDSRRRSILGSVRQDVGLMMYVESWKLKIERNGNLNYLPSSAERARGDPVVTVAIRSDGSVENIIFHRTSGRPELDEAVRRIVRLNARYSAFPPELARRFDVIEIRQVWNFDDRLRILDEVR